MKYKRWTAEDEEVVIQAIKENFDNLQRGFRVAAEKLGRTPEAITFRWYKYLSNPESKHYVGTSCFLMFGEKKVYKNRKNKNYNEVEKPIELKVSLWDKILKLLKLK